MTAFGLILTLVIWANGLMTNGTDFDIIALPLAAFVISLPLFAWLLADLKKAESQDWSLRSNPYKMRSAQFIRITAFTTCLFTLIGFVYGIFYHAAAPNPGPLGHLIVDVLIILSLGVFTAVLHQADIRGQDQKTNSAFYDVDNRISSYASDKQFLPDSLKAAGIGALPTITYKKLSNNSYKLCAVYKTAQEYSYHKGLNCHTSEISITKPNARSKPKPFVKNADGSYTVCGLHTSYYDGEGHVTQGPPITPGSISISSDAYPYVGSRLLFMITAGSREFDENCKSLKPADLTVGSTVSVFSITSPNAQATSIFLKRSF